MRWLTVVTLGVAALGTSCIAACSASRANNAARSTGASPGVSAPNGDARRSANDGGTSSPSAATRATPDLAIVGGTIYPSPNAAPIHDGALLVKDGKIASIGRRGEIDVAGVRVVDASGGTVMAGFQNSHVHFTEPKWQDAARLPLATLSSALQSMLTRYGFTTVVDTGSMLPNTQAIRARIASGEIAGPRILTAGTPLYPPNGIPYYLRDTLPKDILLLLPQPEDPKEASLVVAANIGGGADIVKLFTGSWVSRGKVLSMPIDVASAAVNEAHRAGKLVFSHPSNVKGLEVALAARVDVLAHAVEDTDGLTDDLLRRMGDAKMSLIPTLHLFHEDKNLEDILNEVGSFAKAHGRVLFGTDVGYLTDYDPTDEYQLLARAGLSSKEILATLTTSAAALFGEDKIRGDLAPGKSADIVVVAGDPMNDVSAFAKVRVTLCGGAIAYQRP
jgi:imidazolonepropionase-like amidohydrolase